MAVEYAIDIKSLGKEFRRHNAGRGYSTIKSFVTGFFRDRLPTASNERVVALDNLTLRVPQGASMGIIGRNGSGKSTLLKLITGIYQPSSGSVRVNGRVSALIELGAGFHPDFTGRENLMLGGMMHGLSRSQIDERFDDIVRFAELEHVIDSPVRTYSSGMFMRLGFSLAVHTDPDVLLIDEVLAVGDEGFVRKCKDRISELRRDGVTLLLVTHDLASIERWCDEVVWLNKGKPIERGEPRRVLDAYRTFIEDSEEEELQQELEEEQQVEVLGAQDSEDIENDGTGEDSRAEKERWGSRDIEITDVRLLSSQGKEHSLFHSEDSLSIEIAYRVHDEKCMEGAVFGIGITRADGLQVFGTNTDIERIKVPLNAPTGSFSIRFSRLGLLDSKYRLDVAVHRSDDYPYDYHKGAQYFLVRNNEKRVGVCLPEHKWDFGEQSARSFSATGS